MYRTPSIGSGDSSLSGHSGTLSVTVGGTDLQAEFRHAKGRRFRGQDIFLSNCFLVAPSFGSMMIIILILCFVTSYKFIHNNKLSHAIYMLLTHDNYNCVIVSQNRLIFALVLYCV